MNRPAGSKYQRPRAFKLLAWTSLTLSSVRIRTAPIPIVLRNSRRFGFQIIGCSLSIRRETVERIHAAVCTDLCLAGFSITAVDGAIGDRKTSAEGARHRKFP